MSYVKYLGKMVQYNGKYVANIVVPEFNYLTGFTNDPTGLAWTTLVTSGIDITSAIGDGTSAPPFENRVLSNSFSITTQNSGTFKFYLTVNSGSTPEWFTLRNGSVLSNNTISYTGPGEYTVNFFVSSGNTYQVGFMSNMSVVDFSATNCRVYLSV